MSPREIYSAYVKERRDQPPLKGHRVEALPHLSRATALGNTGDGFVQFANLPAGREDELVREQLRHFDALGQDFEWKVYDFDTPPDLKARLGGYGFSCEEEEAFLVLPTSTSPVHSVKPPGLRIARIDTDRGLDDVVAVQEGIYGRAFEGLHERLSRGLRTAPDDTAIFCAYLGDRPVGTGWIDFPAGTFADLHGGSVLPEARGRGIFSALLHERTTEARRRGYAYVAADTTRMSRPILLAKGFQHVCFTYPLKRK